MRIIHLSDMHFGTTSSEVINALAQAVRLLPADLIVITGDFTQRALIRQYLQAQTFLKNISHKPVMCVPGNHDISLHIIWERLLYPFDKYKHFITPDVNPALINKQIALLGINSVTPYRIKDGYITDEQLQKINDFFANCDNGLIKIVMMHHNLIASKKHRIILNAEELLQTLAKNHVDIVLSGHLHFACVELIKRDFIHYPLYIVAAGTASSHRTRAQSNSFNYMEIDNNGFKITVMEFRDGKFISVGENYYSFI